jgi:hypothetical protein
MALANQIQSLADGIQAELRAGYDYYEHTKFAWRSVQELVDEGRSIVVRVTETGTAVGSAKLARLGQTYVTTYLAESVFQHFVTLFEEFVFGLLHAWLSAHPAGIPFKDKKSIELATVVAAPDKASIIQIVVDRELDALKYKRPIFWFEYLNDRVKLGIPHDDQIERLAEIKAARDILVHNRGIVNETYIDKAGTRARYTVGQRVEIQEPYLHASWLLIQNVVQDLSVAAIAKT